MIKTLTWQRDEKGLLEDLEYSFKPNGRVDWRKMISPEYIVPNRERTQETDISKIEDKDLLLLLQGFKEVAQIRGYSSFSTTVPYASPEFVVAVTQFKWLPNFETQEGSAAISIVTTGTADAHRNNTSGFGSAFLTTIAENRSFVRAVRNFLNIPILGQDEVGGSQATTNTNESTDNPLGELLKNNGIAWESFKNKMIKLNVEGAVDWVSVDSIPNNIIFGLMERVKAILAAAKAKKAAEAKQ